MHAGGGGPPALRLTKAATPRYATRAASDAPTQGSALTDDAPAASSFSAEWLGSDSSEYESYFML
jgi:hypothetical protein